jgi:hypothetical protein
MSAALSSFGFGSSLALSGERPVAPLLPQLPAGRILVLLDDLVGDPVHDQQELAALVKNRRDLCRAAFGYWALFTLTKSSTPNASAKK